MIPKNKSVLYLIPSDLGEGLTHTIPQYVKEIVSRLSYFIVENEKSARHFLKRINYPLPLQELKLFLLNKHVSGEDVHSYLQPLKNGISMGIISEAGCPGIADPGAVIAALCHEQEIKIMPLVGPSSIFLALMASGFNGQSFSFLGYLPIQSEQRKKYIQQIESLAYKTGQTQIFIETPYRNKALFEDLLSTCRPHTKICIAASITLPNERIATKTVAQWKSHAFNIEKVPCVFLLQG